MFKNNKISQDGIKEIKEFLWEPVFGFEMSDYKDTRCKVPNGNGDFKYFTKDGEELIKSGGEWKTQAMIDDIEKTAKETNKKSDQPLRF